MLRESAGPMTWRQSRKHQHVQACLQMRMMPREQHSTRRAAVMQAAGCGSERDGGGGARRAGGSGTGCGGKGAARWARGH